VDEPVPKHEIARSAGQIDQLRKERDAYRDELEVIRAKRDETISAQLRLLSFDLSKGVQNEFYSLLKWAGGVVAIALTLATAGGFFTFSNMITAAVDKEVKDKVKEKDEDIKSLRTTMINNIADFRAESNKALAEISAAPGRVREFEEKTKNDISVRYSGDQPVAIPVKATIAPLPPGILTIPVVVHVVYRTPEENISDEQIKSQIVALNEDYQAKNSDLSKVPEPFKPVIGNAGIGFVLATTDPLGRPTTGITRTKTDRTGFTFTPDDNLKVRSKGGVDPWDTERYLNIWVAKLDGVVEYSQFPGGSKATDGVVISHTAFGTSGTAKAPNNRGRGATHSIAHYLNVLHIWGDAQNCAGNDFVADTPPQEKPNFGKPTFPRISCNNSPNGDMFMNFLDYVDDDSMYMFTRGQVLRMRETLQGPRRRLVQP
jgi:hypothetical protein